MKKLHLSIFFVFLLVVAPLSRASSLCDASCELSIDFTNGGSIEAVDALTLVFGNAGTLVLGEGGTINTNPQPADTDFSSGGTLALNTGDSITFGPGGSLVLGSGGNIDYTSMTLTVDGNITLAAVGGAQTVFLHDNTILAVSSLELNSTATADGNVTVMGSGATIGGGNSIPDISGSGSINIASGGTLTVGSLVYDNTSPVLTLDDINLDLMTSTQTTAGGLTVTTLTQEGLAALEGMSLPTADGNTCTVTNGECVTASGAKYSVNAAGELVPVDSGGFLNPCLLLLACGLLAGRWYFVRSLFNEKTV